MSTSEKKRKLDGREYKNPPPIPCTPKELDMLLDKWIADGFFKPNQVSRELTEEEWRDPHFCSLHNYVQNATTKCWALCRLVHCRIREGTLELSQPEVQRNSLPNHKGKGVAVVIICTNSGDDEEERPALPIPIITPLQKSSQFKNFFNQLELTTNEQRITTEALVSIAARGGSLHKPNSL